MPKERIEFRSCPAVQGWRRVEVQWRGLQGSLQCARSCCFFQNTFDYKMSEHWTESASDSFPRTWLMYWH